MEGGGKKVPKLSHFHDENFNESVLRPTVTSNLAMTANSLKPNIISQFFKVIKTVVRFPKRIYIIFSKILLIPGRGRIGFQLSPEARTGMLVPSFAFSNIISFGSLVVKTGWDF